MMNMSGSFRNLIKQSLEEICLNDPKASLYQIAKHGRTNYSNLKDALEGKRSFSDEMLKALSDWPSFFYTYNQLRLIKAVNEYPELLTFGGVSIEEDQTGFIKKLHEHGVITDEELHSFLMSLLQHFPKEVVLDAINQKWGVRDANS